MNYLDTLGEKQNHNSYTGMQKGGNTIANQL